MEHHLTPGPWETRTVPGMRGTVIAPVGYMDAVAWIEDRTDKSHTANAVLIAAAPQLLIELRALAHLAAILNNRQHAGLCVTPTMWAELYQATNRAQAVVARAEGN